MGRILDAYTKEYAKILKQAKPGDCVARRAIWMTMKWQSQCGAEPWEPAFPAVLEKLKQDDPAFHAIVVRTLNEFTDNFR